MGDSIKKDEAIAVLPASVAIELGEALIDAGTDAFSKALLYGVVFVQEKAFAVRIEADDDPPDEDIVIIVKPD